ncbi:hypothetical protein [Raoultibacter phocaeensis]|uniref:hypothetical protein n=1 Tax=Raoultibacter phocaeensis TaxID=2479841 RepID=UPI0015D62435|nr:hypothetical protein [Raoultibacter phocaeensis]
MVMIWLLLIFILFVGLGTVITWMLFRLACLFDDMRFLADTAAAQGKPVERKQSPLRYFVIVAGTIAIPLIFCICFRIDPFGWL